MYDPDDIQQALADMREQQSSDADYSEITDVQRFHAVNDPERVAPAPQLQGVLTSFGGYALQHCWRRTCLCPETQLTPLAASTRALPVALERELVL